MHMYIVFSFARLLTYKYIYIYIKNIYIYIYAHIYIYIWIYAYKYIHTSVYTVCYVSRDIAWCRRHSTATAAKEHCLNVLYIFALTT